MGDSLASTFRGDFLNFLGLGGAESSASPHHRNRVEGDDEILIPFLSGDFYVPPAEASPFTQVLRSYTDIVIDEEENAGPKPAQKVVDPSARGGVEMDDFTAPPTTTAPDMPDYSFDIPPAEKPKPRGRGQGRGTKKEGGVPQYMEDVALLQERKSKKKAKYIVHRDGTREAVSDDDPRLQSLQGKQSRADAEKQQRVRQLQARRQEALAKATANKPYFTISVTILEIALFVFELIQTAKRSSIVFGSNFFQWGGVDTSVVIEMGGKVARRIVDQNEWWRFFTPIFLHVSIVHIVFNLIMQIKIGMDLEKTFGSVRMFLLYVLCGVGGNLVSSCFLFNQIQAGASGSLFGLLGLMLVDVFVHWKELRRPVVNLVIIIITILLSVVSGMMPGVDNFAHVGGLLVGLVGGFALLPQLVRGKRRVRFCVVIITFPLLVAEIGGLLYLFYGYVAKGNIIDCEWCENINCASALLGESWCTG